MMIPRKLLLAACGLALPIATMGAVPALAATTHKPTHHVVHHVTHHVRRHATHHVTVHKPVHHMPMHHATAKPKHG